MLTGITLENFKAFKEPQFIPIKPITLVFGKNSSGKSSIIHALAFLKWVWQTSGDCEPEKLEFGWSEVILGSWQNLVHAHNETAVMRITLHAHHNAIRWSFRRYTNGPRVDKFEILREDQVIAYGINEAIDGTISWNCFIHYTNPIIKSFRAKLKSRLLDPRGNSSYYRPNDWETFGQILDEWEQVNEFSPLISRQIYSDAEHENGNNASWELAWESLVPPKLLSVGLARFPDEFDIHFGSELADKTDDCKSEEHLLDSLRLIVKGHGDRRPAIEMINMLLKHAIVEADSGEYEIGDFFSDHLHVGAFRNPPPFEITRRKLPPDRKWEPWRMLLYDKDDVRFTTPSPLKRLNNGLQCLRDMQYTAAKRKRQELAFPVETNGEPIKIDDTELVFLDKNNVSHPIQSLGSGVGVVLPMVIAVTSATESFLTIEEPECHAHPGLQTQMGDLLLVRMNQRFPYTPRPGSSADSEDENLDEQPTRVSRMLIETHSEHLILRILRRIRETTEKDFGDWPDALKEVSPDGIKPENVAVLYVEPGCGEEGAKVIELPVTTDGDFSRPWPSGFFTERANELY